MTHADVEHLRARIKAALAESAEEFGKGRPKAGTYYTVPFEDTACHLVNHDDTRTVLTDPAVKALGGRGFTLEISPTRNEIVIAPEEPEPEKEEAAD
jgi:hypothetical protein